MRLRVTSSGAHLRGLARGQHSSEETSQRWRAVGDTVSNIAGPGIEPKIFRTVIGVANHGMHKQANNQKGK